MKTYKNLQKTKKIVQQKRDELLYVAEQIYNRHDPWAYTTKQYAS
ncbi:hypothetical protein [Ulvibacter litoralis]|uniref:Transposase n=1 Tax=Ulvibacter litoralis TaxID=227084 RepID=A0A1G7FED6_9FLAO|nr:hypothetical protein [Ulvibacter litoralis]SDE74240.1 hypothetical protein SAMN05421855_102507 [Ulvibacter litoralis]